MLNEDMAIRWPIQLPGRSARIARGVLGALIVAGLSACGSTTEPDLEDTTTIAGTWRGTLAATEWSVRLGADGTATLLEADFGAERCLRSSGSWVSDEGAVTLTVAPVTETGPSRRLTLGYEVGAATLRLDDGSGPVAFSPVERVGSCVDYGWGEWQGSLTAVVDGVDRSFGDVTVRVAIETGLLEVTSSWRACAGCPVEATELVLRLDVESGALEPASFTVQNVPGADFEFYGFHDTHPGEDSFPGFSTERLLPPGEFTLTAIEPERIRGTFSFRGNPIVEGAFAPDGRESVLLTGGSVDLRYR